MEQNLVISREIDDSRLGVKTSRPIRYHLIPNFNFKTDSLPLNNMMTRTGCEVACNRRDSCRSLSWNRVSNECRLSTKAVKYDPKAVTYLKKHAGESSDPTDDYQAVPGLVGDSASPDPTPGTSFAECKYTCTSAGSQCMAFAYFESQKICASVGDGIAFDADWEYGEKEIEVSTEDRDEHERRTQENSFKKNIQKVWAADNKVQIKREMTVKKQIRDQCLFDKTATDQLKFKKKMAHEAWKTDKKEYNTMVVEETSARDRSQLAKEGFLRFKTRALKASVQKELKQKEGQKITNPKRIKKVYTDIDRLRAAAEDANTQKSHFEAELEKERIQQSATQEKLQKLEESIDKKSMEEKLWDAKHTVAVAEYRARCDTVKTEDMKEQLREAVEAVKVKRQSAVFAEKKAQGAHKAAERANKAMVAEKGTANQDQMKKTAILAGDEADIASEEAKKATKEEEMAIVTKDKLQMAVHKAASEAAAFETKLKESKEYLEEIEKAEQAADDSKPSSSL